jgi:hypothetical protein
MLAEPFWDNAYKNIAPLVFVEVWAAQQHRPTLGAPDIRPAQKQSAGVWTIFGLFMYRYEKTNLN